MSLVSDRNTSLNLPWLNHQGSQSARRYEPINVKNLNISQHSPHPSRVRHIRAFEGPLICVVDTEDLSSPGRAPSVLFPPNQYVDNRLKMAERHFNLPLRRDVTNLVTARPTLDTILAMKFFTGLRNMSFKDQQLTNIVPLSDANGWEAQLHQITTEALAPVIEKFENIQKLQKLESTRRPSTSSSMRRMYRSSGRLLTSRPATRPFTCSHRRRSTSRGSVSGGENFQAPPELDTQVFYLLGGILQNPDPEIVKTWLLTATERERSLMISILRSALIDKDELNMFVAEASKEKPTQIVYTPAKGFTSTMETIHENEPSKPSDVLIVCDDIINSDDKFLTRPPTSSTFRSAKNPVTRPNTRSGEDWIPSESFVDTK